MKSRFFLAAVLIANLGSVKGPFAQDNYRVEEVGSYFVGGLKSVAVVGDVAYAGIGDEFTTLDISNPEDIQPLGSVRLTAAARAIAVGDNYAVVPHEDSGFDVVAISDPERLEVIGSAQLARDAMGACFYQDLVLIADYSGGLRIFDLHDPQTPNEIAVVDTFGAVWDVRISDQYAFLAVQGRGLRILDLSDPEHPSLTGALRTNWNNLSLALEDHFVYLADYNAGLHIVDVSDLENPRDVGFLANANQPRTIDASPGVAYFGNRDGLHVINVADPQHPVETGFYIGAGGIGKLVFRDPYIISITGSDALAFYRFQSESPTIRLLPRRLNFGSRTPGVQQSLTLSLCNMGGSDVVLAEARNNLNCFRVDFNGRQTVTPGDTLRVDVSFMPETTGEFLDTVRFTVVEPEGEIYAALRGGGTLIRPMAQLGIEDNGYYYHIEVQGNYAYLGGTDGLTTIDVSDLRAPEVINRLTIAEHPLWGNAGLGYFAVEGSYAYCPTYLSDCLGNIFTGGVAVVDLSQPRDPQIVDYYDSEEDFSAVAIADDYIYAAGYSGFRVYDRNSHETRGHFDYEYWSLDMKTRAGYAYICSGGSGLAIIDVQDPDQPEEVARFNSSGSANAITFVGNQAFLAAGRAGLSILDVSDPIDPEEIATSPSVRECLGVSIHGDFAFLSEGQSIRVVDITNLENPRTIDVCDVLNEGLVASNGRIFSQTYSSFNTLDASEVAPGNAVAVETRVSLVEGWNMISINVLPPRELWIIDAGPDVIRMTERLRIDQDHHHILLMKDAHGHFYHPGTPFNNIPNWNLLQGYMVKVDQDIATAWDGTRIPADTVFTLQSGWNMIAYFPTYALDLRAPDFYAVSPVLEHVTLVKDGSGRFAVPSANFSNMQPLRMSQGYMIKVDTQVEFSYPPEQGNIRTSPPKYLPETLPWRTPKPTGSNMSLLVEAPHQIKESAWIAVCSEKGAIVGLGVMDEAGRCGISIWGDDTSTDEIDGLLEGERFTLKLWDSDRVTIFDLQVETPKASDLVYGTDSFIVGRAIVETAQPETFYLDQNFPNPFNAVTRIAFGLPEASQVSIRVFDVAGREVATLVSGKLEAGTHTAVWSAEGFNSGVYLVKMETPSFSATKKVTLIK